MKIRFFAPLLIVTLTQLGSATSLSAQDTATAPLTNPVMVTAIKRTTVRLGNVSLPLAEGSKLEVLGRESDSLVVKFRSSKGKVPAQDTDFNPAITRVPEIAPEAAAMKSTDLTISTAAPARDSTTQGQEAIANANRVASVTTAPQRDSKPARTAKPSAPPPPVGN